MRSAVTKTAPGNGALKPGRGGERVTQAETMACAKVWTCGWHMMVKEEACKGKGASGRRGMGVRLNNLLGALGS